MAAPTLDIRIGTPCIVEPQGVGERFKSVFLGWEQKRFCLLKPPANQGLSDSLYLEKPCIVRYLDCNGVLCGFRTQVQALTGRPHRLLFVDYPESVETLSVRKENRVDCFLPATITIAGADVHGHIVNISAGGFRFSKHEETGDRGLQNVDKSPVDCRFSLIDEPVRTVEVKGEVRGVAFTGGMVVLKAEFVDLDQELHTILDKFVSEVSEHLDLSCDITEGPAA